MSCPSCNDHRGPLRLLLGDSYHFRTHCCTPIRAAVMTLMTAHSRALARNPGRRWCFGSPTFIPLLREIRGFATLPRDRCAISCSQTSGPGYFYTGTHQDWRRFNLFRTNESVIRHSPSVARTTATAICQLRTRRPHIALAAIESIATILVMDVSTFTRPGVARWLRQLRGLTGKKSLTTISIRRLVTATARLDADGVIGIGDVMELHRATGQLHGRLDALAMPPGHQVELHRRASSVSCASNSELSLAPSSSRVQVSSDCCSQRGTV
jgi:hypothetical protein